MERERRSPIQVVISGHLGAESDMDTKRAAEEMRYLDLVVLKVSDVRVRSAKLLMQSKHGIRN